MPNIIFKGEGSGYNSQKGIIKFVVDKSYRDSLAIHLKKLGNLQQSIGKKKKLQISMEYDYKSRTLDQNRLMWSLYQIEANEQNGGIQGDESQMVTKDDLYESDVLEYAPVKTIIVQDKMMVDVFKHDYKTRVENIQEKNGQWFVSCRITTSRFNTVQMAQWINRQFNRLLAHGVTLPDSKAIELYWRDWQTYMDKNKIVLYKMPMNQKRYKDLMQYCEATGLYLGQGGDLAHIKSIGSEYGKRKFEPKLNYPVNWLHLCREAHQYQHAHGWPDFLEKYPHLNHKVNKALSMEFKEIPEDINEVVILAMRTEDGYLIHEKRGNLDSGKYAEVCRIDDTTATTQAIKTAWKNGKIIQDQFVNLCNEAGISPTDIDPNFIDIF